MSEESSPKISAGVSANRNPTDAERIEAPDWLVREANTKQVWIAQGCYCFIGMGRKQLVEGDDLTDALDALVALQEDTADVG